MRPSVQLAPLFLASLLLAACDDDGDDDDDSAGADASATADAATGADAGAADAASSACLPAEQFFVLQGPTGPSATIDRYQGVLVGAETYAEPDCAAAPTGLAVGVDGRVWLGLADGAIVPVAAGSTACVPLALAGGPTGAVSLVALPGGDLLALDRASRELFRIDVDQGSATSLGASAVATAEASLLSTLDGPALYVPAGLGGEGQLHVLAETGAPGPARIMPGISTVQAQASAVSVAETADGWWIVNSGFYGAGGAERTRWSIMDGKGTWSSPVHEYYAVTRAVATAPCAP